jgi:hypothetical protein
MATRRANHECSIYKRSSDGLWKGAAHLGYDPTGKPIRKYVSAKNRPEVVMKLKKIRRDIDEGLLIQDMSVTLSELFDRWFDNVMLHQIAPSTLSNYKTVAAMHILPTLGKKKLVDLAVVDVDKLLSTKVDCGLSTSTVRRIRTTTDVPPVATIAATRRLPNRRYVA